MPLNYVGPSPQNGTDLANRLQAETVLTSGPVSQISAASDVDDAAATKASKTYIDTQDQTFELPAYYQSQDALNIPLSTVGQPNGVASLNASGKVPLAQFPPLGAGYLLGPFGPTSVTGGSTGTTPVLIANFAIGVQNIAFQPWVFATVLATPASYGRPVIEAAISDGSASYAGQTIVARGVGRSNFNDLQAVAVSPCPAGPGMSPTPYASTTNIVISLWLRDLNGQTSTVASTGIPSAGVYLLRVAQ